MIKSTTKKSKRPYRNSIINYIVPNFVNIGEEELRDTISLLLDNYTASACNFIKKETLAQVFSCEFCLIFKDNFFTKYPCFYPCFCFYKNNFQKKKKKLQIAWRRNKKSLKWNLFLRRKYPGVTWNYWKCIR